MLELSKGEVGGPHRRPTLLTRDPEPDVRLLYHGDVVGTVADGGSDRRPRRPSDRIVHELNSHAICELEVNSVPISPKSLYSGNCL